MLISKHVASIKESPTLAIMDKARQMQAQKLDVAILAAGEPDFDTPQHIKDAAIKAILDGKTKYTSSSGILELKKAIVNKFHRENNLNYATNQIIVSNGAKHCIYNTLKAIINEGDEIIIPSPYWVSYPDMVLLCGGVPVTIKCDENTRYKLTAQQLESTITNKTKALILNSPSNPTGMVYTETELKALADVLEKHPDVIVISDDIYEHILFEDKPFLNIANVSENLKARTVVINGVSKAYAMTGWRIGFLACDNTTLVKTIDNIQSQSTSNACTISQYAALAALNGGLDCVKPMRKAFIERHNYVVERINKINGLSCLSAQGAFYTFFKCDIAIENMYQKGKISEKTDLAFANYLLDSALVAGVPGSAFGLDNHIRISFATSLNEIILALDRIEQALK